MTGAEANGPEADDGDGESISETGDDAGADQPEANSGSPPDNDSDTGSQDSSGGSPPDSGSDTGSQDSSGQDSSGGGPPDHGGGSQDDGGGDGGGSGSRMTLIEHLTELRSRIIKAVIAVGAGALACWFLYPLILDLLPFVKRCFESLFSESTVEPVALLTPYALRHCQKQKLSWGATRLKTWS